MIIMIYTDPDGDHPDGQGRCGGVGGDHACAPTRLKDTAVNMRVGQHHLHNHHLHDWVRFSDIFVIKGEIFSYRQRASGATPRADP